MNKLGVFKALTALCLLAVAAPAQSAPRYPIEVASTSVSEDGTQLNLSFRDREPVASACDYHVSRFEYVEAAALLIVELRSATPCLVDRYGRRLGQLSWTLPSALRGAGRLGLVLNQLKVGEVAISGSQAEFFPILFVR